MSSASLEYPPDADFRSRSVPVTFTQALVLGSLFVVGVETVRTGTIETSVPYNYPLYLDGVLLVLAAVLLRRSHRILADIIEELRRLTADNLDDPLFGDSGIAPADIDEDLGNVLFLAFEPRLLIIGGLLGGGLVYSIMAYLGVLDAYPYDLLNFGFGAAHGVFFGPVLGILYILLRASNRYIVDINLLDPDGVGGYRKIGNGIVKLATYGILIITFDFAILSSVAFTSYEAFQTVVAGIYLLVLGSFILATIGATVHVRSELLTVRERKTDAIQTLFTRLEHRYWDRFRSDGPPVEEAVNVLALYAMFHQMSRMNMWPINLYSLSRLTLSISFSLLVFIGEVFGIPFV